MFLRISQRPGMLNWEQVCFWLSKDLYKQCGLGVASDAPDMYINNFKNFQKPRADINLLRDNLPTREGFTFQRITLHHHLGSQVE